MAGQIACPKCGSTNIQVNVIQENRGTITKEKTTSKYKEKRHGCLWWLVVGWWWWIIDLLLWIFAFIPRALMHIGRHKKYKGSSTTTSTTKNIVGYKTVCVCQNCGYNWEK